MSFATSLKALTDKCKGDVEKATRQAMILAAQSLVLRSPVASGRFRANWQFGVGSADTSTTEATDPGGSATLANLQSAINAAKIGGVWVASNSLPYARRLELGWSRQAPSGMVRLTVQELPDMIQRYVKGSR